MERIYCDRSFVAAKISSHIIAVALISLLVAAVCDEWLLVGLYLWSTYPSIQLMRKMYDKTWQIVLYGVLWPYFLIQNVMFVFCWYYFD